MLLGDRGRRWRCLLVWASGTSTVATSVLLVGARLGRAEAATPSSWRSLPLDRALVHLAAGVLLTCAAWAWLALSVTVVEAWRGVEPERLRAWHLPDGVRRVVLAACGVALATSVTTPALADDGASHPHPRGQHRGAGSLAGLPLPDRAVAPRPTAPATPHTVLVRRGDCLWSLARHDLPGGAPAADIDARWRAIFAANHRVIGPDPDVLEPGQRLRLPRKEPS